MAVVLLIVAAGFWVWLTVLGVLKPRAWVQQYRTVFLPAHWFASAALFVLVMLVSRSHAEQLSPTSGLCYSTDGRTVTTTYLGGDPYPVPVQAEVRVVDGGYEVTHRALFRRLRVWLPVVSRE